VLANWPDLWVILDVTYPEPPNADSPLWTLPNVVLTPHIASATAATRLAMADLAASNLIAALTGAKPLTPINPQAWPVPV
ncbi:MAG: hypothetical protein H7Z19_01405, partial [Chitinophagaceae bacterium]|nr:hypothetical protein [Rubrivivax sp.]